MTVAVKIRQAPREDVIESYLIEPPRTDDELHHFLQAATGAYIPRRAACPDHQAPFSFIADLFFGRARNALAWASRGSGKTFGDAALFLAELLFKPGFTGIHFGATDGQARAMWNYLRGFLHGSPAILAEVKGDPLASRVTMNSGNLGSVHPLTWHQASSPHRTCLSIDELDRVTDPSVYQQVLSIPLSSEVCPASTRLSSTHDTVGGLMGQLIEEGPSRGFKLYSWCVLDVLKTCPEEFECGTCAALSVCGGSAKDLPPGGWMQPEDLIAKCQQMDQRSLRVSWFNAMPGMDPELMIYGGSWSDTRNICEDHDVPRGAPIYLGADFGQRNSTFIAWAYLEDGVFTFFDELELIGRPSQFLAEDIRKMEERPWHPFHPKRYGKSAPDPLNIARFFVDPSAADYRANLRAGGLPTWKAKNERQGGINSVRWYLETGRARFMRTRCPKLIGHLKRYRWIQQPDGKPVRESPLEVDDHGPDAVRYLLHSMKSREGQPSSGVKVHGI